MSRAGGAWWAHTGLWVLFLLPTLVYAGVTVADRWYQSYLLAQEEAELRVEISELRRENLQLQGTLIRARSDQAVESVAREQLGLVRQGDRAFALVGPPSAPPPRSDPYALPAERPDKPPWRRLLEAILGR
jgi:cell division protein FtsB